ncbi:transcription factor TFIID complex subunit 8 C-term-domain-containing protein [Clohesyomyces aquaticus]|uniref:Transcription initiation factor TFIID subunit 8 n=1 Tax=Clohesyomyces aquaticus TaxID=1231657 RepID=A0A1Y1ZIP6_9PLEO|nr:transcription factor TFIID complex subunit 8 C-term-domain-containing protein [Clohesyomyces aquaticus]
MAGIRHAPTEPSTTPLSGQKRPHEPSTSHPPKKRKTTHSLQHTQPTSLIPEPINPEHPHPSKDFFTTQLHRAIAIELKAQGFDSALPSAMARMHGLVDSFMLDFLARVRQSMSSARRTETLPHDWIYALNTQNLTSSSLDVLFDTGPLPPSILVPGFAAPEPASPPPPDIEGLIGPELSGKKESENRKWIPAHFPPFPSLHTWRQTPVFTEREQDPRVIRERATEEGVKAEMSLRRLMMARKMGVVKRGRDRRGGGARGKGVEGDGNRRERLWREAMGALREEEWGRERDAKATAEALAREEDDEDAEGEVDADADADGDLDLEWEKGVHANYDQGFWRRAARDGHSAL